MLLIDTSQFRNIEVSKVHEIFLSKSMKLRRKRWNLSFTIGGLPLLILWIIININFRRYQQFVFNRLYVHE